MKWSHMLDRSASGPTPVEFQLRDISFPWIRLIALLVVGCPALLIATVVSILFLSYFNASTAEIVEINGHVFGTWLDIPSLLVVGSACGALGVALTRMAWSALAQWRADKNAPPNRYQPSANN